MEGHINVTAAMAPAEYRPENLHHLPSMGRVLKNNNIGEDSLATSCAQAFK
jgi:hypothetical protein